MANMVTNKLRDIDITFSRLYVKFYIGKRKSKRGTNLLDLIRDEIRLIVLITITQQLENILRTISDDSFNIEEKLDILFRLLILSSKKKVLKKLHLVSDPVKRTLKRWQYERVLTLLEVEDYDLFVVLVRFIVGKKFIMIYTNQVFLRLLLEHLILKIATILIYDIFFIKKIPSPILGACTTDLLFFSSYNNKLRTYLIWQRYRKSFVFTNDSAQFFVLTKDGITVKTASIEKYYLKTNESLYNILIARSLRLVDKLIMYITCLISMK